MMQEQYIVVCGNPVDGFTYVGPFADHDTAENAGDRIDQDWWIAELEAPETVTP
jgi:hypothetical protein